MTEAESVSNTSFVRWQGQTIAQLSVAINLFISLATASLGLAFGWMTSRPIAGCAKGLLLVGELLMLASLFCGCVATVTRLLDFRTTAKIARRREGGTDSAQLADLRAAAKKLGGATWILFWFEIGSFLGGVVTLVASVIVASS